MREVFEAFLTDPVRINQDVYAHWLQGLTVNDALNARLNTCDGSLDQQQALLWRDTIDQYRLFEKLEYYLLQPTLFRSQLLFQIPPIQQFHMIERYYALDGHVTRSLIGQKLTGKLHNEPQIGSPHLVRRHMENIKRMYLAMEDRNFQGQLALVLHQLFMVSETLASKYASLLFLVHARFQVHPSHPTTGFLQWKDLLFMAALMMVHWIPQRNSKSTIALRSDLTHEWPTLSWIQEHLPPTSVRSTLGVEFTMSLTNALRDLKAHLINDVETLTLYKLQIMNHLTPHMNLSVSTVLENELNGIIHGLLTIGAGLSQPKEYKDIMEQLILFIIHGLKKCQVVESHINELFTALIDSLTKLDVWYLHSEGGTRQTLLSSWERYLSVCRVLILIMYDRVQSRF